jgi:prepilin-type N-terminal cleavage/methylation domain-containing protein
LPAPHVQSPSRRPGFTLVEIVIVIGLLSLVTGLVVANVETLLPAFQSTPLEVKFRQAAREARIAAATSNRPTYLRFDAAAEEFRVIEKSAAAAPEDGEPAPLDLSASPYFTPEVTVDFFPIAAEEQGVIGGSGRGADEPVPELAFHPSGTSTPARIVIRWRTGEESVLTLDPFSSGPLASKELFQ